MKKILAIASLVLTATLSASVNIYGGTSSIENGESNPTFGTGYDLMFIQPKKSTGFELGLGIDVLYATSDMDNTNTSGDVNLILGFKKNDFGIKGAVGYGVSKYSEDATGSGLTYSIASEYNFTNGFGMGAKYKIMDYDIKIVNSTVPASNKNLLFYLYFSK